MSPVLAGDPSKLRRIGGPLLVGAVAGFLSGLFGVGGGLVIVPALVFVLALDQRLAHGTSLAAVVLTGLAGAIGFALQGSVDVVLGALLLAGSMGGVVVGTSLLRRVPQRTLRWAFIVIVAATAVRLFVVVPSTEGSVPITLGLAVGAIAAGVVAGVLAGLLGVGGGLVMVPAMVLLFGVSDLVAKGTSLLVIIPTALIGTWRNQKAGNVRLDVSLLVGAAGAVTAFLGVAVATRLTPRVSVALFGAFLLLVACRMAWEDLHGSGRKQH